MNKQRICALISILFVVIFVNEDESLFAQTKPSTIDPSIKDMADQMMQTAKGNLIISYHDKTGKIRFMRAESSYAIPQAIKLPANATPEIAARNFLQEYGVLFGIKNQRNELKVMKVKSDERGRAFIRFQQVYTGIPVIAGELIAQLDASNKIVSINCDISPYPDVNVTPTVSINAAKKSAREIVTDTYNIEKTKLITSMPELCIYNPALLDNGNNVNNLVWRVEVTTDDLLPIKELVLVDAHNGEVLLHYNQIPNARDRLIYDNENNSTCGLPGCNVPVRTEGDAATGLLDADLAYDYSGDTYNFYFNYHNRDSINNEGMSLISTVRYCDRIENCPYENAFWNGWEMVYGQGYSLADDVVAHEITHGVTSYESNLEYINQSGAINESFSDMWGEFVDLTNGKGNDTPSVRWLMGEDLPRCAVRNMQNPPQFYNPDKMSSEFYDCDYDGLDLGGVHQNSGINNKAVYLMVDGGSFNGKTVSGIGIIKTAKIYYEAQTNLLTTASGYASLYNVIQAACSNLIGVSGITATDCEQVKLALDAVEMNQPRSNCSICYPNKRNTHFFDNLESGSANWSPVVWQGSNAWSFSSVAPFSGTKSMYGADLPSTTVSLLRMTSSVYIPPNRVAQVLHFNHAFEFEYGTLNHDGGLVVYSIDNGANWNDAGPLFIKTGYNGTLYDGNTYGGRHAFVGTTNGNYIDSILDLTRLVGKNVIFGFLITTDSSNSFSPYGWFIDDVRIYSCELSLITPCLTTITTSSSTSSTTTTITSGTLKITKPNGGESWNRNSMRKITWNTSGNLGTLKLTLWQNGALIGTIADGLKPAAGSYSWSVGTWSSGIAPLGNNYTIRIEEDYGTVTDVSDDSFSIVKINVKTPNGFEVWQIGSMENITWSAKFINRPLRIILFKNDVKLGNIVASIDPALGTYSWTVGSYEGGIAPVSTGYQVQVREIGSDAGDRSDDPFVLTSHFPFISE